MNTSSAPETRPIATFGRKGRCKYCGNQVPIGVNPCPHCGHELKWSTTVASGKNKTTKEISLNSELLHDPGAEIRGISLFVLVGLAIAGIAFYWFGLTQTEHYWGGTVLSETGRSCVSLGGALLGLASVSLLPMLSFAAWRTSRWKCGMVKKWMEESSSPVYVSWSLEGSVEGWSQFFMVCSYLGGVVLAIVILALSFGEANVDPFMVQLWAGEFSWVLLALFWSICLKEQLTEVKNVRLLMKKKARGDTVQWTHAQIMSIIDDLVSIPEKTFSIGKFAVTQAQWEAVMGNSPSQSTGDDLPVESVSWEDCQSFLQKLNATEEAQSSGMTFRLPTEEEWEYACRAGATGRYCKLADGTEITESSLGEVAWFIVNSDGEPHPVGQKKPNAFGLFDMHGNVWEWTQTEVDGMRINCGGSCRSEHCEASFRGKDFPSAQSGSCGFRLCADRRMSVNQG